MRTLRYKSDKEHAGGKIMEICEFPEEITLDFLADMVERMRHQQRRYFATRSPEVLQEAKRLEAQVDAVIAKMHDKQMTLF